MLTLPTVSAYAQSETMSDKLIKLSNANYALGVAVTQYQFALSVAGEHCKVDKKYRAAVGAEFLLVSGSVTVIQDADERVRLPIGKDTKMNGMKTANEIIQKDRECSPEK